jgi:hypothetical protein
MLLFTIVLIIFVYLLVNLYSQSVKGDNVSTSDEDAYLLNPKCGILNRRTFINDNYGERFKKELDKTLKNISNTKYKSIKTVSTCKYITCTTPLKVKLELENIINNILTRINVTTVFNFNLIEINNIEVFLDNSNNKQYICDILVNDNKNYLSLRLKLDIIVKYIPSKHNNKVTCSDITTPPFKKYRIGTPSNDQLIPLPSDVIVTERSVSSTDSINKIEIDKVTGLQINYISVLNCDDVINGFIIDKDDEKKLGGVNDGKNEFSNLEMTDSNPFIEPAVIRNKWVTFNHQPNDYEAFPCQEAPKTWNILGVPPDDIKYTAKCQGKRESTEQTDLQGQTWPTLGTVPRRNGDNAWLFDLSRGITSFPTGRST